MSADANSAGEHRDDTQSKSHLVDDVREVRSRVCNAMLIALSITIIPALAGSLYRAVDIGWKPLMAFHIVVAITTLLVTFLRNRLPYTFRAGFILGFFFVIGLAGVWQFGMISASVLFLILAGPIASLFFEGKLGIAMFILSQLCIVIFGYLFVSGIVSLNVDGNIYSVAASSWITLFFGTLASGGVLAVGIYVINRYLIRAVKTTRFHAEQLEQHQESLEQVIEERTHELKQSNEELERFAQIAAHDMKSPMNMISGHAQLLEMKYKHVLDAGAKNHIDEVVNGILRLSHMINDLLLYSRVISDSDTLKELDMNVVFDIARKQLSEEMGAISVTIGSDVLPTVIADEHQMVRVFQNLLGNAIRYRDCSRPLEIYVGVKRDGADWVFSIVDNGIGINADQLEKVFDIYHKASETIHPESSGIGLAACQKIIKRHNGKIWVESELGRGSTFYFTLGEVTMSETLK